MLRECRRVLRSGGRLAFHTIQPGAGLTKAQRRRAHAAGPIAVAVPTSYSSLLRTAGFTEIEAVDITADYRATLHRWISATERREPEVRLAMGDEAFDERMSYRRDAANAIDEGLLKRFQYTGTRP